jgi:hypothetical protein
MVGLTWHDVERLVGEMEEQQRRRVLDLARRLRPGLTLEDVQNPHDFPELSDPDWQYEDGALAGIQSVLAAVRSRAARGFSPPTPSSRPGGTS